MYCTDNPKVGNGVMQNLSSNNFGNLSSENNRIYSVLVSAESEHTGRQVILSANRLYEHCAS